MSQRYEEDGRHALDLGGGGGEVDNGGDESLVPPYFFLSSSQMETRDNRRTDMSKTSKDRLRDPAL